MYQTESHEGRNSYTRRCHYWSLLNVSSCRSMYATASSSLAKRAIQHHNNHWLILEARQAFRKVDTAAINLLVPLRSLPGYQYPP